MSFRKFWNRFTTFSFLWARLVLFRDAHVKLTFPPAETTRSRILHVLDTAKSNLILFHGIFFWSLLYRPVYPLTICMEKSISSCGRLKKFKAPREQQRQKIKKKDSFQFYVYNGDRFSRRRPLLNHLLIFLLCVYVWVRACVRVYSGHRLCYCKYTHTAYSIQRRESSPKIPLRRIPPGTFCVR